MATNTARLPSKSLVNRRIRVILCKDSYADLKPGTLGTVSMVDDAGTVHVNWDNGSTLGLCWSAGDRWMIVPDNARAVA